MLGRRAEEAFGWRPIETAPKDGTPVLLCGRDYGIGPGWHMEVAAYRAGNWYILDDTYATLHRTHWMPLPDPPEDPSEEEREEYEREEGAVAQADGDPGGEAVQECGWCNRPLGAPSGDCPDPLMHPAAPGLISPVGRRERNEREVAAIEAEKRGAPERGEGMPEERAERAEAERDEARSERDASYAHAADQDLGRREAETRAVSVENARREAEKRIRELEEENQRLEEIIHDDVKAGQREIDRLVEENRRLASQRVEVTEEAVEARVIELLEAAKKAATLETASFGFPHERIEVRATHLPTDDDPRVGDVLHPDDYIRRKVRLHHRTWIIKPIMEAMDLLRKATLPYLTRPATGEAPGHTDLMVTPESLDEYLETEPPAPSEQDPWEITEEDLDAWLDDDLDGKPSAYRKMQWVRDRLRARLSTERAAPSEQERGWEPTEEDRRACREFAERWFDEPRDEPFPLALWRLMANRLRARLPTEIPPPSEQEGGLVDELREAAYHAENDPEASAGMYAVIMDRAAEALCARLSTERPRVTREQVERAKEAAFERAKIEGLIWEPRFARGIRQICDGLTEAALEALGIPIEDPSEEERDGTD